VKRWIVVSIVLLALIIMISPAIVGRMAERSIEANIDWSEQETDGLTITTESFARGWFTSVGQHRVALDPLAFVGLFGSDALPAEGPPELIIDTRIDHGLVPVASLSRESGSLIPGLASTRSTFQLDSGDGVPIELPGVLYSRVTLSGATDSHLALDAGEQQIGNISLSWQGADLNFYTNHRSGMKTLQGSIEPIRFVDNIAPIETGEILFDTAITKSPFGFSVGKVSTEIEHLTVGRLGHQIGGNDIRVVVSSSLDDELFNGNVQIQFSSVPVINIGQMSVQLDTSIDNADARAVAALADTLAIAAEHDDPKYALEQLSSRLESELQELIAAGADVRIDQLDVTLPQGMFSTTMSAVLAASDPNVDFSWPAVLLNASANMDLRLPVTLYDFVVARLPEAATLLAFGLLERDGDDYVMKAVYEKGVVKVNGAPLPIMQLLQD